MSVLIHKEKEFESILYVKFKEYLNLTYKEKKFDIEDLFLNFENYFNKLGYRNEGTTKNILIIRDDEIGDFVLSSGLIREVKRIYKNAKITLVVNPEVYNLAELCPYVDAIYTYKTKGFEKDGLFNVLNEIIELCKCELWKYKFDLCICPRWEFDKRLPTVLGYISGARERIGYSTIVDVKASKENNKLNLLLTKSIIKPDNIHHEAEKNFFVLESLGYKVDNKNLEVWFNEEDDETALALLNSQQKYKYIIAVVPGAGHPKRMWDVENYAELIGQINNSTGSTPLFLILGAPNEIELGNRITAQLDASNCINLIGRTSLRQTAAILSHCHLYIGSDTGSMHIAAANGVAVLSPNCCSKNAQKTIYYIPDRIKPWKVPYVFIYPDEAVDDCRKYISAHGCIAEKAHCINQISVNEMFVGWKELNLIIEKRENLNKKIILMCMGNIGIDLIFYYGNENVEFYCDYQEREGTIFGRRIISWEKLKRCNDNYRVIIGMLHEKFMLLIEKKLMSLGIEYERYWDEVIDKREKNRIEHLKIFSQKQADYVNFLYNHEINYMLNQQKSLMIPYKFIEKYKNKSYEINYDNSCEMYFYIYKGKKLYFPQFYTLRRCQEAIEALLIEQDTDSPHRYFIDEHKVCKGDIFLDIGGAEGIASLDVIDIAEKIYIFEYDNDWIKALEQTFSPYKDKVVIISKMVGHKTSDNMIRIDDLFSTTAYNLFIKVDIEGNEDKFLMGAYATLNNNNVRISLSTYHKNTDAFLFSHYFKNLGYKVRFTDGYIYRSWDDGEFVRGVLIADNIMSSSY